MNVLSRGQIFYHTTTKFIHKSNYILLFWFIFSNHLLLGHTLSIFLTRCNKHKHLFVYQDEWTLSFDGPNCEKVKISLFTIINLIKTNLCSYLLMVHQSIEEIWWPIKMCGVCEKKILCERWLKANQGEVYQTRIYSIIQKQQNDWRNLSLSIHYELKRKYLEKNLAAFKERVRKSTNIIFFIKNNLIITLNIPFNI